MDICALDNIFTDILCKKHHRSDPDVKQLLDDAVHFMQQFLEPIRRNAAHIYISAIPLTSPTSLLYKTYAHTLQNIPRLISGALTHPTSTVLQDVMAISLDRSRFVRAHDDNTLWVWDV